VFLKTLIFLLALPVLADEVVVIPGPMPKIMDVALPVNPHVVGGKATVDFTPDTMTVTPSTNRTWIQYDSFDVGKNATVRFQQGPGNLTVNEVTGSKMSDIAGRIHVTGGSIVLMNRNGQIFKDGAILDGNIMVSTVPLNQQEFMNSGKLLFQSAGLLGQKPWVTVGSVKASGLSVFIAPWFESVGLFTGNLHVFSGESVSLSLCGNTLARFEVQGALKDSLIDISDKSQIEGKQVILHAGHMEDVINSAIQINGSLKAQDIMVVGDDITLSATSTLDVSGESPGMLRVGVDGDYNHLDPDAKRFPHVLAQNITIREGAKLLASSETGDAGTIYTFANKTGDYKGTYDVSSTEGPGGLLELSAHDNLQLSRTIDWNGAAAPGKKPGTLLLDPDNITITGNAVIQGNAADQGPGNWNPLFDGTINTALANGDVNITATDTLTLSAGTGGAPIHANINWNTSSTLTLRAATLVINGVIAPAHADAAAAVNLITTVGLTMASATINMGNNLLNITSPALITGGFFPDRVVPGSIHQNPPNKTKIRVTGPGFKTGASVAGDALVTFNDYITPITTDNYTIVTLTPANVLPIFDGFSIAPIPSGGGFYSPLKPQTKQDMESDDSSTS